MTSTEKFKHDYLPLQPAMQRMAESILHDEDAAADAVQDCFVKLWSDREKLATLANPEAWCITLVKHRCIDMLRQQHPTEDIDTLADRADEEDTEGDERLQLALSLMQRLPKRQAQAIRLRHFEAMDTSEIAKVMNVTENNLYVTLSRAYNTLRKLLNN